jgi:hypothetical protein
MTKGIIADGKTDLQKQEPNWKVKLDRQLAKFTRRTILWRRVERGHTHTHEPCGQRRKVGNFRFGHDIVVFQNVTLWGVHFFGTSHVAGIKVGGRGGKRGESIRVRTKCSTVLYIGRRASPYTGTRTAKQRRGTNNNMPNAHWQIVNNLWVWGGDELLK